MRANKALRNKITAIVQNYESLYPQEFCLFSDWMKKNNEEEKTEWAEFSGSETSHMLVRKLGHKPQTLQDMLFRGLDEDEFKWLIGDKDPKNKGSKWFFETFTEYATKGTDPEKKVIRSKT